MRFQEGDKVRNLNVDMGVGIITRHSDGPMSIRWVSSSNSTECWWVNFPDYHDPKWIDPEKRGETGWFYDTALEPVGAYEGHVRFADSQVVSLQCFEGRHDECPDKTCHTDDDIPERYGPLDGYVCECGAGC